MLKFIRPAMKSALRMSLVVARKPAVLITALRPNSMPSRLMMKTRPLAVMVPSITEGPSPPVTRLSVIDEVPGWLNVAEPPVETLNVFQLMMARSLVWLTMTELVPAPVTVALPPTTLGPVGCAPA